MRADVYWNGDIVGEITGETDAFGARIKVVCRFCGSDDAFYRCYAIKPQQKPMLIGLLEPQAGKFFLSKHISKESSKMYLSAGFWKGKFVISADSSFSEQMVGELSPQTRIDTGDRIINQIVAEHDVLVEETEKEFVLRSRFSSREPFLFAPAFAICRVEKNEIILKIKKKHQ